MYIETLKCMYISGFVCFFFLSDEEKIDLCVVNQVMSVFSGGGGYILQIAKIYLDLNWDGKVWPLNAI